jgi:hypothetical protein
MNYFVDTDTPLRPSRARARATTQSTPCSNNSINRPGYEGFDWSRLYTRGSNDWMTRMCSLTHVHFADMSSIESVGSNWMSGCYSLVSIDFRGLPHLNTVGHIWMYGCDSIISPNFGGLAHLQRIGNFWMAH